ASRRPLRRSPQTIWRRRAAALAAVAVLGLAAARAALPWAARAAAVRTLGGEGWRADIRRVHLSLWRGAWRIDGLKLQAPGSPAGATLTARSVEIALSAPRLSSARARARLRLDGARLDVARPAVVPELIERLARLPRGGSLDWT